MLAGPALAQQTSANEQAYTLTLTCYVVAGHFGDNPGVAKSGDAMRKMANVLGYSTDRIASDTLAVAKVLGVESRRDATNMERHRGECRRYGLVS